MIISTEILIFLAVLLVLALIAPLFSPFFRKLTLPEEEKQSAMSDDQSAQDSQLPPVSIIITDHDNAYQLSHILDKYLTQDYPADYQVVIVVDETDMDSIDVLNQKRDNPHLYYTKLPVNSRYLSRKKLAMTIGMRAAKYDWCILTSIYCSPNDDQWLKAFCSQMKFSPQREMSEGQRGVALILGMTPYEHDAPRFYRYEHLRSMLYHLRLAEKGMAFSTTQLLVALHKADFFSQQGFSGNLEYQRAEFEFLVNKFAEPYSTALALQPSARLTCKCPTKKQWYYRHMNCIDSFSAMKRALMFRMLFHLDIFVMHLYNIITFLALIAGLLLILLADQPDISMTLNIDYNLKIPLFSYDDGIALISATVLFWLISQIIRMQIYKKTLRYFGNVSPFLAIIFDWFVTPRNMWIRLRYLFTSKYDFMTHRL